MKLSDIFNQDNNIDTALDLFEGKDTPIARKIISQCKNKQDIYLKAIELCEEYLPAPKALYITSYCYVWLGAKYRKQAIEYLEKYIAVGAVWEGTPSEKIKMNGYVMDQYLSEKATVYSYLGKAYEGEYMFDKAEKAYTEAEKLEPYFATHSVCIANTYIKKNDLKKALAYISSKTDGIYYKNNVNDYKTLIDDSIENISQKIQKGYVYKSRKK